ncbi:MAG: four helix bundle protein [Pyrinomonadaceae bacterium MAG19_C2-C3]|nr:four helix bundle protein [Pyrinomonadaceae bacterium MAG19_C2-C3]
MSNRIERFEDFIAWQKARVLAAEIYKVTDEGKFAKDFGLRDQIRRAVVSVMSNIAEGFERGRATEFHQFLSIAKASCAELRSQLYIALDAGHLTQQAFDKLMRQAVEVGQIIGGLRASVERRRDEKL